MSAHQISSATAIKLVGRGVFIEVARRKEFYVLLILMGIFVVGAGITTIVGVENASTATMLLNLGISLAAISAHILTGLTAARQIPTELETRTLYPLLAKPIARAEYVLGKWAAATACGCIAWTILFLVSWIAVPKVPGAYSFAMLAQAYIAMCASLGLLAAIGLTLSLAVPQGMNLVLLALLVGCGDQVANFIRARAGDSAVSGALEWLLNYLPRFSDLNLIARYTDGISPLGTGEFVLLLALAAVQATAALALGVHLFSRRPL